MKRYLITRVYNNLPSNRKNDELSRICRKFIHAELTEREYRSLVEDVRQLVERANAKYPRTTALWVHEWVDEWIDEISIVFGRSDKSLSISITPIEGNYETIKAAMFTKPEDVV